MIILHLIYDTRSFLACSLARHPWYIVTVVPHLRQTPITQYYWDVYNLGLLPLVKEFHICGAAYSYRRVFPPEQFSWCTLCYFTALTNVQELGIDYLREPRMSRRQIIYDFLGVERPWRTRGILCRMSPGGITGEASRFDERFRMFRTMCKVRGLQLVFCADIWDGVGEYTVGVLKRAMAVEKVKKRLDDAVPEPLIIHSPRGSRHQAMETCDPLRDRTTVVLPGHRKLDGSSVFGTYNPSAAIQDGWFGDRPQPDTPDGVPKIPL